MSEMQKEQAQMSDPFDSGMQLCRTQRSCYGQFHLWPSTSPFSRYFLLCSLLLFLFEYRKQKAGTGGPPRRLGRPCQGLLQKKKHPRQKPASVRRHDGYPTSAGVLLDFPAANFGGRLQRGHGWREVTCFVRTPGVFCRSVWCTAPGRLATSIGFEVCKEKTERSLRDSCPSARATF